MLHMFNIEQQGCPYAVAWEVAEGQSHTLAERRLETTLQQAVDLGLIEEPDNYNRIIWKGEES